MLFIPLAYLLLFFFSFGIALVFSITTVFFRDLQYVIGIAMQALFFLTPILYKSEALAGKVAVLINYNPVGVYIELFRAPLYTASLPDLSVVINAMLLAIVSMLIGMMVFIRQEKKIVFRL
jgi:ABC-type polysaccharide/polyol phosphate export permease